MNVNLKTKSKNLITVNSPLIEYIVNIHINIVDKKGNMTPQSFAKKFDSANMLTNRKEAIEYYKTQLDFFLNTSQIIFSSPKEARIKNYKDYKSFSITLQITDNQENCIVIDETDSLFDFLSYEYNVQQNYQKIDFILVKDNWGDNIKVMKEDYDFFTTLLN